MANQKQKAAVATLRRLCDLMRLGTCCREEYLVQAFIELCRIIGLDIKENGPAWEFLDTYRKLEKPH